ncbi:metallo-mystery pair system four-Cys motif protein [Solirubrobacter sp. CPCC 204708]|uniref:Metallo-mystery pair system four-Cys motif protein n=1 Tax=Solirubrobacter deserti TaxID=2282478 RepID=A0ABT4RQZ7_9ACTN|nr:MbnP family copper-binding protein [Solirubrobacter deserti]MBE2319388.1 metallo-mystery pair system four-Cys motif protein [Solirubrobacter deserti]MDA0140885.1 metallo-mystery pair system four-Cys motif protein [Solirubrobacter deserti]
MPHVRVCGALALALALSAAPAQAQQQKVDLKFTAVAGDEPIACGTPIPGLGSTAQAAQLQDLRFFVSEVKLIRRGGKQVPVKLAKNSAFRVTRDGVGVTLIDLEDGTGSCSVDGSAAMNDVVRGTVPKGKYVGVRWTVGVPFALNHTDAPAVPAPLNSAAMAWSWQVGRKFTKIEFADPGGATGAWSAKTFFIHLGSAGCEGNPATGATVKCAASNRPAVKLKTFDPAGQQVAVDVGAMLAGNDITLNRGNAPGCMSGPDDPECAGIFSAFGLSGKQTVFRPIDR